MDMIFNLLTAAPLMGGAPDATAFEGQATMRGAVRPCRSRATSAASMRRRAGNAVVAPSEDDFQPGGR